MNAARHTSSEQILTSLRLAPVTSPQTWDEAIASLGGGLLQSWNWGEFKSLHGWRAVRMLGSRNDRACIAAQILIRSLGPFSVLYVPRGPVSAESSAEDFAALTLAIDRLAADCRAAIAFMEPEHAVQAVANGAGPYGWKPAFGELQPLRTIKVGIAADDGDILAAMKSKTRYNVRLAARRGVKVRTASPTELPAFYELLAETSQRDRFGIHSLEYYTDMLSCFSDSAALLLAEFEEQIVAGAIVLVHRDEAIYMFGASSGAHQRHMPSYLLQFEAMRWARERGCRTYDLWGIPATDEPPTEATSDGLNVRTGLWGVYRFKQGFGGEVISYPGVFERQYYPWLVSAWRTLRPGLGL